MKIFLNCCKPNVSPLFRGEKAEAAKAPVSKPAELKNDTVELSKKVVETKTETKEAVKAEVVKDAKAEVKPEAVKTEVKTEAKLETKPAEIKKEVQAAK